VSVRSIPFHALLSRRIRSVLPLTGNNLNTMAFVSVVQRKGDSGPDEGAEQLPFSLNSPPKVLILTTVSYPNKNSIFLPTNSA
jgi:hypothetical protein